MGLKQGAAGLKLPPGVKLSPFGLKVFAVLGAHTSFAWPIIKTQCAKVGVDPATMTARDLGEIIGSISAALEQWTNPQEVQLAVRELRALCTQNVELPADAMLSDVGLEVFDVLKRYSVFAWPVIKTVCGRHGVNPAGLARSDLAALITPLCKALESWTSPEKAELARDELEGLLHRPG